MIDINKPTHNPYLSQAGKGYKFVFIDLDDTLWDFHSNANICLQLIFEKHHLNENFVDFDAFFSIYARRNLELWDMYGKGEIDKDFLMMERFRYPLALMGVDDVHVAKLIGDEYLALLPTQHGLMPNAREMLDYLSSKYTLTLISNGFVDTQYQKMRSSNIEHYFKYIVLSEQAEALKPDKKIFEYALQLNNAQPHETIMIGDSYLADICGARNAGIDQAYYPNAARSDEHFATYIIDDLLALKGIL